MNAYALNRALRREVGKLGTWYFHRVYVEPTVPDAEPGKGGRFLWNVCSWLDIAYEKGGQMCGAFPREHMKTTVGTTSGTTRQICYGFKRNIGVGGVNKVEASDKMRNIMFQLEDNPRIREDFGEEVRPKESQVKGRATKYSDDQVILQNGVRMIAFSILGKIRGQNVGGRRMELLVLDDIEDDESVESADQRDKQWNWLMSACFNSMSRTSGSVVWMGTILHDDSLLNRAIRGFPCRSTGKPGTWLKFKLPAYDRITLEPLWPEWWKYDQLMTKKRTIGSPKFAKEYMNTPISEEDQAFKPEWWRYYDRTLVSFEQGRLWLPIPGTKGEKTTATTFMAVDPAISKSDRADWFAYIVVGVPDGHDYYFVLDVGHYKLSFQAQLDLIREKWNRWEPVWLGIEAEAYQAALQEQAWEKGIPARPIKHGGQRKESRIKASAVHVEQNRVYLPYNGKNDSGEPILDNQVRAFIEECEVFPAGEKDDFPDVYCMAIAPAKASTGGNSIHTSEEKRRMFKLIDASNF